jgi:hypothetical protein
MRELLPFILVALALFTAGCIAYIAWELSSDKKDPAQQERGPAADPD